MKRPLAWLVCALALALGVYFFTRSNSPAGTATEGPAPQRTDADSEPKAQLSGDAALPRQPEMAASLPQTVHATTVLAIRVVEKESGRPRAGVVVSVRDPNVPRAASKKAPATRGSIGVYVKTAELGVAEFEVPPNVELELTARSSDDSTGTARMRFAALSPGEQRDVRVELLTGDDATFHGLVRARETSAPLGGARILVAGVESAHTTVDGRFTLPYGTWRLDSGFEVHAPGYAHVTVFPAATRSAPEAPFVIALERCASLAVQLVGFEPGAAPRAQLVLGCGNDQFVAEEQRATAYNATTTTRAEWRAEFDAAGRARIDDLPPRAWLSARAVAGAATFHEAFDALVLEPGELRTLEWRPGKTCRVTVDVRDAEGRPVPGVELLVVYDWNGTGTHPFTNERPAPTAGRRSADPVFRRVSSDAQGRAVLDAMPAGDWAIGPAPRAIAIAQPDPSACAPTMTLFRIAPADDEKHVDVRVEQGLYISGVVLRPDRSPASKARVSASRAGSGMLRAQLGEGGSFLIGPLGSGEHRLVADSEGFAGSDFVFARAGTSGVELQLRPAGTIRGRVVDGESGAACKASVSCTRDPVDENLVRFSVGGTPRSEFEFNGLAPGTYNLFATAPDGRAGLVRSIAWGADDVVVPLAPGARLRVRLESGRGEFFVHVLRDGARIALLRLNAHQATTLVVPPGKYGVELQQRPSPALPLQEVELAAGEERELVFREND